MMFERLFSQTRLKLVRIALGVLLLLLDVGLTRTSYRRMSKLLTAISPQPDPFTQDLTRAARMALMVNGIARHPAIQATCLRRTLLTWWLLRWLRLPSDVRIGINTSAGHAWLEHHGTIINDRSDVALHYPIIYTEELTPEKMAKLV
jgi:hypothetical protein